jgi:ribonuclease BN (tRNA processing enzyme)
MTRHVLKAWAEDIEVRLHGFERAAPGGCKVNVHEIQAGTVYRDELVRVKAFRVKHGSWREAFGFRFETADRTIVISGDTRPCPGIRRHARQCDVLVHEVYCESAFEQFPRRWRRYHGSFHTSSKQLARLATATKPGVLVLYHQLLWGATEAELLAEIRERYSGPVVSGNDGDVY